MRSMEEVRWMVVGGRTSFDTLANWVMGVGYWVFHTIKVIRTRTNGFAAESLAARTLRYSDNRLQETRGPGDRRPPLRKIKLVVGGWMVVDGCASFDTHTNSTMGESCDRRRTINRQQTTNIQY